MPVIDRKAGYSFVYPFGWQVRTLHPVKNHATLTPLILCSAPCACCIHLVMLNVIEQEVSVQGQDKVYKDVIEPAIREWTSRLLCIMPLTSSMTSAMRCCAVVQPRSAAAGPLLTRFILPSLPIPASFV